MTGPSFPCSKKQEAHLRHDLCKSPEDSSLNVSDWFFSLINIFHRDAVKIKYDLALDGDPLYSKELNKQWPAWAVELNNHWVLTVGSHCLSCYVEEGRETGILKCLVRVLGQ